MKLNRFLAGLLVALCFSTTGHAATTLLPPPKQCFQNANGPLASGTVQTYVPNTTTPKTTWTSSSQATANPNPITLDINGCALIYGVGSYRFIVQDSAGNQVYDQVTTDPSSYNSTFWAGTAGGTPNAITVTYPGFTGTDGSIIQFIPIYSNTGSVTINPSGFGAIPVVKDTTAGAVSLVGGEISAAGTPAVVSVIYSAAQSNFHIQNPALQTAGSGASPLCGATGLKITNGGAPNSIISLTADRLVLLNAAGTVVNRQSVVLNSINITTGTTAAAPNGMDGESPGASQWLYVYAIDNGTTTAGLVSTSATAPTMPSGYGYICRLGAMRTDGSGNLFRTLQNGRDTVYTPVLGSNTTSLAVVVTNNGAPTAWSPVTITASVPPTASKLKLGITSTLGTNQFYLINPNNQVPSSPSAALASFTNSTASQIQINSVVEMNVESNFIYWGNSGGTTLSAYGWTDRVNAN